MYHILFGFDSEDTIKAIIRMVKKQSGLEEIEYSVQTTKDAIQEYIKYNKECDTLVLREVMEGESWSAEELAELNDYKSYNIIIVVDMKHKGTEYVQILYTAGITNAFLLENGDFVKPEQIAHYILNPRNRANARRVYGLDTIKMPINILTSDIYLKKYAYLMDETQGVGLIDRYLIIVKSFSVKVAFEFTKRLPLHVLKRISEYEEFWRINEHFSNCGFKLNIKRPKQLRKGMTDEAFRAFMKTSKRSTENEPIPKEYRPSKYDVVDEPEPSTVGTVSQSDDYFDNMLSLFDTIEKSVDSSVEQSKNEPVSHEKDSVSEDTTETDINTPVSKKASVNNLPSKTMAQRTTEQGAKKKATKSVKPNVKKSVKTTSVASKPKQRGRISWKVVLSFFALALLGLIAFYFVVGTGMV